MFRDIEKLFQFEECTLDSLIRIENGNLVASDSKGLARLLHTCPSRFLLSSEYFENNCSTMLDFIRWYNLLDCHLLCQAIEKYAAGFLDDWNTNIHSFRSVSLTHIQFLTESLVFLSISTIFSCRGLLKALRMNSIIRMLVLFIPSGLNSGF